MYSLGVVMHAVFNEGKPVFQVNKHDIFKSFSRQLDQVSGVVASCHSFATTNKVLKKLKFATKMSIANFPVCCQDWLLFKTENSFVSGSSPPVCMCLCCAIAAEHHESSAAEQAPRGGPGTRQNAAQCHAHRQTWRRPDDQGLHPGSASPLQCTLLFVQMAYLIVAFRFDSRFLFLMTLGLWPCSILTPSSKETTCRSPSSTRVCPKSSPSFPR